MSGPAWPVAELDAIARMRALAAGLPHVALVERVIEAPFEAVWGVAGDLEAGVPRFDHSVRRIEIRERAGERIELMAWGPPFGMPMRFDATLRPGWCVMQSWAADIGMAAAPDGPGRTRFAHYEGSRWFGRALRGRFARMVARDLENLARLVEGQSQETRT